MSGETKREFTTMGTTVSSARNYIKTLDWRRRVMVWLGVGILKLMLLTIRCRLRDEAKYLENPDPRPFIALFWHNRILAALMAFKRYYPARNGILVLTSASRDGAFLAEVARHFKIGAVRGSSSRRGVAAFLDLTNKVEQGFDIAITPDGPRGPRYHLHPGGILLAQRSQLPLMLLVAEFSSCWRLKSWDGFIIPKPFSEVIVTCLPLEEIAPVNDENGFEKERQRIENLLRSWTVMQ
ncbi:MAG: lysophospholipid acyltransferase family protein [Verrucomicrobia bacterium]|nr:lysophospholipid acyltransferase family protein [Verrucomicrobiota bacterium]